MERKFFDWKLPFLSQVAVALVESKSSENHLDLSETILAFPSRRGLHRFEEILVAEVERRIAAGNLLSDWRPPIAITVGRLPELVYELKKPFANSLTEILAWRVAALAVKKKSPERFNLLFPFPPKEGDFRRETEMAGILARLHHELASEGLDFLSPLQKELISKEADRWRVLREIQEEYLATLDRLGLWDVQTARIFAVKNQLCQTDKEIILIGAIDLNAIQKKILHQISSHVRAFIFAPESKKAFFDAEGCVIPDQWEKIQINIPDEQIFQTPNPVREGEMTAALALQLAERDGNQMDTDSVAVGVPDPETIPFITEEFIIRGISVHPGSGMPAGENRVLRLLSSASSYLKTRSFASFADWVRHPDVERFFLRSHPEIAGADWISALDRFQNHFIPEEVDVRWGNDPIGGEISGEDSDDDPTEKAHSREVNDLAALKTVYRLTEDLFTLFQKTSSGEDAEKEGAGPVAIGTIIQKNDKFSHLANSKRLPFAEWPSVLSEFLEKIYSELDADKKSSGVGDERNRQIDEGLSLLYSLFDEASEVPSEWLADLIGEQMIDFLLKMSAGKRIPPPSYAKSVELIGWLDLALDDHPNLVIAGFNNGIVPSSQVGDLFLPNSLRRRLGIEDNSRRFARDAFFFSAILASRNVRLLFARRSLDGDPRLPSRLLLTGEAFEIARRINRFFGEESEMVFNDLEENETNEEKIGVPLVVSRKGTGFNPPVLRMTGAPPTSMRVTEFADFLASPYRYFLRRHLRLEPLGDQRMELDAATFGNIVHDVLKELGDEPEVRESVDEKTIADFLHSRLDLKIRPFMLRHPAGTVYVQTEQIRNRLSALAQWQAAWRQKGNRIRYAEAFPSLQHPFMIEGDFGPVLIRGRIDRIDFNAELGQWFIFDYKTFDGIEMGKNDDSPLLFPGAETFGPLLNMKTDNLANRKHRKRSDISPLCFDREREEIETADAFGKKKKKTETWVDLQLPLYHKLAAKILEGNGLSFEGRLPISAYIVLPKSAETVAFAGNWSREELNGAFLTARWVVRMIQRLWRTEIDPNAPIDPDQPELGLLLDEKAPSYGDDFAAITGSLT